MPHILLRKTFDKHRFHLEAFLRIGDSSARPDAPPQVDRGQAPTLERFILEVDLLISPLVIDADHGAACAIAQAPDLALLTSLGFVVS